MRFRDAAVKVAAVFLFQSACLAAWFWLTRTRTAGTAAAGSTDFELKIVSPTASCNGSAESAYRYSSVPAAMLEDASVLELLALATKDADDAALARCKNETATAEQKVLLVGRNRRVCEDGDNSIYAVLLSLLACLQHDFAQGRWLAERLLVSPTADFGARDHAVALYHWFVREHPGTSLKQIGVIAADAANQLQTPLHPKFMDRANGRLRTCNPSIVRWGDDGYLVNLRVSSYYVNRTEVPPRTGPHLEDASGSFSAENILEFWNADLQVTSRHRLIKPPEASVDNQVEDVRLFVVNGTLHYSGTFRRVLAEWNRVHMVMGVTALTRHSRQLAPNSDVRTTSYVHLSVKSASEMEKNWLPVLDDVLGRPRWIYSYDPFILVDPLRSPGKSRLGQTSRPALRRLRGSAAPVQLPGGRAVSLSHFSHPLQKYYYHRWVLHDSLSSVRPIAVSEGFCFQDRRGRPSNDFYIEFAPGLCLSHDSTELLVTFGYEDAESYLARIPLQALKQLNWYSV